MSYQYRCNVKFISEVKPMKLSEINVRQVVKSEEEQFKTLMQKHHYLGFVPKIGKTTWYVAEYQEKWVSLLSFSVSALKCAARDKWIGWDHRHQYGRLKLVINNNRFLILPDYHIRNLASKVLSLCFKTFERRLAGIIRPSSSLS